MTRHVTLHHVRPMLESPTTSHVTQHHIHPTLESPTTSRATQHHVCPALEPRQAPATCSHATQHHVARDSHSMQHHTPRALNPVAMPHSATRSSRLRSDKGPCTSGDDHGPHTTAAARRRIRGGRHDGRKGEKRHKSHSLVATHTLAPCRLRLQASLCLFASAQPRRRYGLCMRQHHSGCVHRL
jgi:hypothetical protein